MVADLIVSSLATIAAAFAGAWAAFRFEDRSRRKETVDRHVAAANRALYTVFNLWNILAQFRKEVIDPVRGRADTWLNMPATVASGYGLTSFQADELAFLLQTDYAQAYTDLLLEEQRFAIAMELIRTRSQLILSRVFPRMAAAGVAVGGQLTENDIVRIVGIDTVHELKPVTESIVSHVDEDVQSLRVVHNKLRAAMKGIYPKKDILRVRFEALDGGKKDT